MPGARAVTAVPASAEGITALGCPQAPRVSIASPCCEEGRVRPLVREQSLNARLRSHDHDFSAGRECWRKTAGYGAQVCALFDSVPWRPRRLHPKGRLDGTPRFAQDFALARRVAQGEPVDAALIETTLRKSWNTG